MANYIELGGEVIGLVDNGDNTKSLRVRGKGPRRISATMTRPGDATQYAAGDQVADSTSAPTAIEFADVVSEDGGKALIQEAICVSSFNQATKPNLRLYLFGGTAAPTPNNDNAAWNPSDADMNNYLGHAEFTSWEVGGTTVGGGGNCASRHGNLGIVVDAGAAVSSVWGLLVERGTYTPGSVEAFKLTLGVIQD